MKKKLLSIFAACTLLFGTAVPSFSASAASGSKNKIALFENLTGTLRYADDPALKLTKVSDAVGKYFESYSNYKKQVLSVDASGNACSAPYDWGLAPNISIDKTVTKDGRPSIKIVNDKPATRDLYFINDSPTPASKGQYRSQFGTYMWLEKNTTYEFNCSMIVEDFKFTNPFSPDVTLGARLRVRLYSEEGGNEPYGSYSLTDQGKYCLQESCADIAKGNKGNAAKGEWYTPEKPLEISTGNNRYFAQVDVTLWGGAGTAYFNDVYAVVSGDGNPYEQSAAPTTTKPASPNQSTAPPSKTPTTGPNGETPTATKTPGSTTVSNGDASSDTSAGTSADGSADESGTVSTAASTTPRTKLTGGETKGGFPWAVVWTVLGVLVVGGGAVLAYFLIKSKKK